MVGRVLEHPTVLGTPAMSTKPPQHQDGTEPRTTDHQLPTDALRVGVDSEGATHYYSRIDETMFVIMPDRSVETEHVTPGERFNAWLQFVEARRGWTSRNVATDIGELIREHVTVTGEEAA
mgnify:CR=1 FL=1